MLMIYNHKVTGRALSMPASFAIGLCISLGTTLVLSAILAQLISKEKIEWERVGYWIIAILLAASAIGTKATCVMIKRRKAISCLIAGVLYWLALLTIAALFYGGQYTGIGVTGIVILFGCTAVCLLELKGERRSRRAAFNGKSRKTIIVDRG